MQTETLAHAIATACGDSRLIFQVTYQNETLSVIANRAPDCNSNVSSLVNIIRSTVDSFIGPEILGFWLHSRSLGSTEPEFSQYVEMVPASVTSENIDAATQLQVAESQPTTLQMAAVSTDDMLTELAPAAAPTSVYPQETLLQVSEPEPEHPKALCDYCFIRNQALLKAEILPPAKAVAQLIETFHYWPLDSQLLLCEWLEPFFLAPKSAQPPAFKGSPDLQEWIAQLQQLNRSESRKASIWLSRYCANPEQAWDDIQKVVGVPDAESAAVAPPPPTVLQAMPRRVRLTPPPNLLDD